MVESGDNYDNDRDFDGYDKDINLMVTTDDGDEMVKVKGIGMVMMKVMFVMTALVVMVVMKLMMMDDGGDGS